MREPASVALGSRPARMFICKDWCKSFGAARVTSRFSLRAMKSSANSIPYAAEQSSKVVVHRVPQEDSHDLARSLPRLRVIEASDLTQRGPLHCRPGNHTVLTLCLHGRGNHHRTHCLFRISRFKLNIGIYGKIYLQSCNQDGQAYGQGGGQPLRLCYQC